jgi:hypothetical protein
LLIASHLVDVFDEYRGNHRVNNLVHKVDDDLMSAIRVLCMQIRSAKALSAGRPGQPDTYRGWSGSFTRPNERQVAKNVNFDLFNPQGDVRDSGSVFDAFN